MNKLLFILLMVICSAANGQLGKYGVTVTSTVTPVFDCTPNTTYTFCVTVDNFNQCGSNLIDALEVQLIGNWQSISYVSSPANWRHANQIIDEPAGWLGWGYNSSPPPTKTWDDVGENTTGPRTFCFSAATAVMADPCWSGICSYTVDVHVWGDGDTGGGAGSCLTQGTPDGPYTLMSTACIDPLDIELLYFICEEKEKGVELVWRTAYEKNIKHYIVEHSNNGQNWEEIVKINPNNTIQVSDYRVGLNQKAEYYRLSLTEQSGRQEILKIITCDNVDITEANTLVNVYDVNGKLLKTRVHYRNLPRVFPSGVYIIQYFESNKLKIIQLR